MSNCRWTLLLRGELVDPDCQRLRACTLYNRSSDKSKSSAEQPVTGASTLRRATGIIPGLGARGVEPGSPTGIRRCTWSHRPPRRLVCHPHVTVEPAVASVHDPHAASLRHRAVVAALRDALHRLRGGVPIEIRVRVVFQ